MVTLVWYGSHEMVRGSFLNLLEKIIKASIKWSCLEGLASTCMGAPSAVKSSPAAVIRESASAALKTTSSVINSTRWIQPYGRLQQLRLVGVVSCGRAEHLLIQSIRSSVVVFAQHLLGDVSN